MKLWAAVVLTGGLCVIAYLMIEVREPPAAPAGHVHRSPPRPVRTLAVPDTSPAPELSPVRKVAPDPAVARSSEDTEAKHARPAPSPAEVRDGFDAWFHAEAVDLAWSQRTTDALTRGLQAVLPAGSRLQRLECRGTLCRVETSHANLDEFHSYARDAFNNRETRVTTSGAFASLLGDPSRGGPMVSVAFLAREGTQLPGLDVLLATR